MQDLDQLPKAPVVGRPRVTLVTGVPGSGKTTLGSTIARALQIPFIARDDVRRGLYLTAGGWTETPGPVPTARDSGEAFLRMIGTATALGVSLIAESVIRRDDDGTFDRLTSVADCRVIVTEADPAH